MSEEAISDQQSHAWDERRVLRYLTPGAALVWMLWPVVLMAWGGFFDFLLGLGWPSAVFDFLAMLRGDRSLFIYEHTTWVQTIAFAVLVACGVRALRLPREERAGLYRAAALSVYWIAILMVVGLPLMFGGMIAPDGIYTSGRRILVHGLEILGMAAFFGAAVGHWRRKRWAAWFSFAVPILPWVLRLSGLGEPNHPDWEWGVFSAQPTLWQILSGMDWYAIRYTFWLLQESTDEIFHFTAALVALRLYSAGVGEEAAVGEEGEE